MYLPEKTRLVFPIAVLLWLCSFVSASAQNWQEYHVLNQDNYLSFQRTFLFYANLIQSPDPALGVVELQTQGSQLTIRFTPTPGAEGTAEFIVEYFPNQFPLAPRIEAFRVFVATSFITAEKDFVSVVENSTDNILDVLANDVSHYENELNLTVSHIAAVKNGTANIVSGGETIEFTPSQDFTGMAYLTYVVCDELGACAKAEVNISVLTQGNIPQDDTIYLSTHSRSPVVAVMPLDSFVITDDPDHGTATSLSPETWQYTPDHAFDGIDGFTLTRGNYTRHVVIDVYYKDAPNTFANADKVFTRINEAITFDVLANDVRQYPVDAYTEPEEGTLAFNGSGQFTYTPATNYKGAQLFSYTTCFMSKCETADVIVYIGDMIPENSETYTLVTQKDVSLVLNYEIPLTGYNFAINALPSAGTLNLYSGEQSVTVSCSTIEGYDLLVYTPPTGFSGSDYFEIVYCIDGGECHLVKVNVKVEDGESMPCPCVDHCVWPGDADGSGQVNMNDLLSLGWQLGYTGPNRNYPDNTAWMGQTGDDWSNSVWGMNSKYADSDGDGVISSDDVAAIESHYMRAHTLVPEVTGLKADYSFEIVPLVFELDSGDLAIFDIVIGSDNNPVLDMHGLSFSLNLPMESIDSTTVEVEFYQDSWLSYDAPSLQMQNLGAGGRLDAAFTRTTGKPASGIGALAKLKFIVDDDIDGIKTPDGRKPLRIGVNGVNGMASNGLLYDVDGTGAVVYLTSGSAQSKGSLEDQVFIYPNPSDGDQLNVHTNGDRTLKQIEVLDLSGTLIGSHHGITTKHFSPDISGLQNGLYFLRITTSDGVVTKKFEVF